MKYSLSLLLCIGILLAADGESAKTDTAKLEGTWTTKSLHYNGKDYAEKYKFRFVIKADQIAVEGNDAVKKEYGKITFKLLAGTKPKGVDLLVGEGVQKDAAIAGIYELKGDELTICAKVFGKDRPTEFASPAGSSIVLLVMKREKS